MRLARFRTSTTTSVGAVLGDRILDVAAADSDLPRDLPALFALGSGTLATIDLATRDERADRALPLDEVTLLAPIERPPKLVAIGLNYADHIAETGSQQPDFPVFFNKQSTCVIGPGESIHVPRVSTMVDYEGELAMVIGRRCRHVPVDRALEVVGGYTIINDVTVRDWQLRAPTMTIGKSFDTHGPLGPWVVTDDEVPDPQALRIRTWVGDDLLQDGSTEDMIFTCAEQIATLSTACTLEPGDVIATGTPAGVGIAQQPPRFLLAGDTVRIEIDGIGVLENPVVEEPNDTAFIG